MLGCIERHIRLDRDRSSLSRVDALVGLGCARERVINVNRDFYRDVAEGRVPHHHVLLTNPPYSADHKQKLLSYLLRQQRQQLTLARPFLLLMPAWVAGTDYWQAFVADLAATRTASQSQQQQQHAPALTSGKKARAQEQPASATRESRSSLEKRAGLFYVSPFERYNFAHPQSVWHANSPFHAVWFCGGWPSDAERREAVAALAPLRKGLGARAPRVEVFRAATMLQKRGHYELGRELVREAPTR